MTLPKVVTVLTLASVLAVVAASKQDCGQATPPASPQIYGGSEANPLEFPWMVRVRGLRLSRAEYPVRLMEGSCGGSLISKNWVLTAAHCVSNALGVKLTFGQHNLVRQEGYEAHRTSIATHMHPRYNTTTANFDYALLKLRSPLELNGKYSHLKTICLPTEVNVTSFDGINCWAAGWGHVKPNERSDVLKKVAYHMPDPNDEACKPFLKGMSPTKICAIANGGDMNSICDGDSGGPLQCFKDGRWYLVGVTSMSLGSDSDGCYAQQNRAFFESTNDPDFRAWLTETIGCNSESPSSSCEM